jgi:FkbM family methyltransferase
VDYFICVAENQRELMSEILKNAKGKIVHIAYFYNSLTKDEIHPESIKPKQFLFVGRIVNEKGLDILIKVISRLAAEPETQDISLKIAGDGPELKRLQKMVSDLGLERNIEFLGAMGRDKLDQLYQESIAVVIPSAWMESGPFIAYEAMKNARPVIISNVGGCSERVDHGKSGWLFEMGSVIELSKYMKEIFNNVELSIEMGKNGLEKLKNSFNAEIYYEKYLPLIENESESSHKPKFSLVRGMKKQIDKIRIKTSSFRLRGLISRTAKHRKNDFYFVQIGSNDGKKGDPIHEFVKKYKWQGLLVEPVPSIFKRLQENYKGYQGLNFENVAIAQEEGLRSFYRLKENDNPSMPVWYDQLGSFNKEVIQKHRSQIPNLDKYLIEEEVRCIPFMALLKKHSVSRIDLLHIDAEGYDYEIIKMIDFTKVKPAAILYEHRHLSEEDKNECTELLKAHGYKLSIVGADTFAF